MKITNPTSAAMAPMTIRIHFIVPSEPPAVSQSEALIAGDQLPRQNEAVGRRRPRYGNSTARSSGE
jgi:hypothetical protein